ncbi:hypothetical protein QBC42DRAFT_270014 [Cladorrhinum samala]|uniref:Integral membrane protein n=1 Tax=Cladorrhinum samala TaxID=585594 RepID=A0AAV9HNB8_9PEZI|nr:hypothetical protein QBC42DRAFT_270014 [Cladorrhinum samala]
MTANIFQPECTTPPEGTNFVKAPLLRSTLSILWSSLLTIFLCTWSVQHLAIPARPRGSKLNRMWTSFWRKFKWMGFNLLAPEFMVGKALGEFVAAHVSFRCENMAHHGRLSGTGWTRAHAFYANMGGFILDGEPAQPDSYPAQPGLNPAPAPFRSMRKKHMWMAQDEWDDVEEYYQEVVKASGATDETILLEAAIHFPVAINSAHLCLLLETGAITELPGVTADDINDMSKEDFVIKLVVLGQVLWLVIELVVRKIKGLHTTQLEITALAFAACTFITYLLWLEKPKDATRQTPIHAARELTLNERISMIHHVGESFIDVGLFGTTNVKPGPVVRNDRYTEEGGFGWIWSRPLYAEDLGFALGGIVFGAIHCIAWNFAFPTDLERLLWRISSVITAAAIPALYAGQFILSSTAGITGQHQNTAYIAFAWSICFIYISIRLFLIAEVFHSLFYSPPDTFQATWSTSIPHVA